MFNSFPKATLVSTIAYSSLAVSALVGTTVSPVSAQTILDLELSLLVDISGSIDELEYDLQLEGYSQAFQNLSNFDFEPFATNFVVWSGGNQQEELIGWTLISDAQDALDFSNQILGLGRPGNSGTAPGNAILAAREGTASVTGIFENQFEGNRLVFDVSGDGSPSSLGGGIPTATQRDLSQQAGITINGLAILSDDPSVVSFYQNSVITSDGFFVLANDFTDFSDAVTNKIQREVINEPQVKVPEPTSLLGLLAFGGLTLAIRRKN